MSLHDPVTCNWTRAIACGGNLCTKVKYHVHNTVGAYITYLPLGFDLDILILEVGRIPTNLIAQKARSVHGRMRHMSMLALRPLRQR